MPVTCSLPRALILCAGLLLLLLSAVAAAAAPHAAASFRAAGEAVAPAPDGTIFCEAEEFKVEKPGWLALPWGANYYAATFANTFLSRKAFLGAPENCEETVATINVDIKEGGKYLVLARYEAPYRFEAQFRIKVEQGGKTVLERLYGARDNVKIWAFRQKLQKEVAWSWGAVENVVWEGHDAYANLQPGPAKISLIAGKQPAPQAKRNVDIIMLTRDEEQVKTRIDKENYLPLDGWLTQAGDVWLRVANTGPVKVKVESKGWQEHSPYWVHMRNWKPVVVEVEPGQTSDWVDVGGTMDTLNDGQWNFKTSGPCTVEFGVKAANGRIDAIKKFDGNGDIKLAGQADTRYSRKIRTQEEGLYDLLAYLKAIPMHGKTPVQTLIYGYSFSKGLGAKYDAGVDEFMKMFALKATEEMDAPRGYIDLRGKTAAQLEEYCTTKLNAAQRQNIAVVSLGDEIGLPAPTAQAAKDGFVTFLKNQGLQPSQVDPAAGDDWTKVIYNTKAELKQTNPGLYYWSTRYLYYYGIQEMKALTDVLKKHLPNAHIGANFSPHHGGSAHSYLGEVFKWVSCFKQDGMTLPWSEDYAWQVPIGTQQMNAINLDLSRAGNRGKPGRKILYYVMPHWPGNTPNMWRRLFYNALGHGMTIVNLFEFRPVWAAYTENHVTSDEMYGTVLKTFREMGLYEDIVQSGQLRPAEVGLWFSETGDIWGDNEGSFGSAKRALYIAILHNQLPLDFIVEDDALDGTLNEYRVLYLTDNHVSQAASRKLAEWVRNGGRLFATAGAGMYDEYNRPNTVLRQLLGVEQKELLAPAKDQVGFLKQDLPFAQPVETVTVTIPPALQAMMGAEVPPDVATLLAQPQPVFGAVSRVNTAGRAMTLGVFKDRSPALVLNMTGAGMTLYCAFLPGLSYFKPAIPMMPLDRGSTDDAMAHFIPTQFNPVAGRLIGGPTLDIERPVESNNALVEATVIEARTGTLIPLANWSGKPVKGLRLVINIPAPTKSVTLASGGQVKVDKLAGNKIAVTCDIDVADALILR